MTAEDLERIRLRIANAGPLSEAMTLSSIEAAQKAVPEIEFVGWTSFEGPSSIQGPEDGERAIGPLLDLVNKAVVEKPLAIILGCFDDTGLQKAKQISLKMVCFHVYIYIYIYHK